MISRHRFPTGRELRRKLAGDGDKTSRSPATPSIAGGMAVTSKLVAAVSAFLTADSSGKFAILRPGSGALMVSDLWIGKAHGQEFADCGS